METSHLDYQTPGNTPPRVQASRPARISLRAGIGSWLGWLALYIWTIRLRGTFLWGTRVMFHLFAPVAWAIVIAIPLLALTGLIAGIVSTKRATWFVAPAVWGMLLSGLNLIAIAAAITYLYILVQDLH